ncbi:MAG: hypothetical protein KAT68_13920 [Bacteroidales bacterium]|nr:hypothetical protein [Bacteroidales bacterium]
MILKDQILNDVSKISNHQILNQLYYYLQSIKKLLPSEKPNKNTILRFAGLLSDKETEKLTKIINSEFNRIEGEW